MSWRFVADARRPHAKKRRGIDLRALNLESELERVRSTTHPWLVEWERQHAVLSQRALHDGQQPQEHVMNHTELREPVASLTAGEQKHVALQTYGEQTKTHGRANDSNAAQVRAWLAQMRPEQTDWMMLGSSFFAEMCSPPIMLERTRWPEEEHALLPCAASKVPKRPVVPDEPSFGCPVLVYLPELGQSAILLLTLSRKRYRALTVGSILSLPADSLLVPGLTLVKALGLEHDSDFQDFRQSASAWPRRRPCPLPCPRSTDFGKNVVLEMNATRNGNIDQLPSSGDEQQSGLLEACEWPVFILARNWNDLQTARIDAYEDIWRFHVKFLALYGRVLRTFTAPASMLLECAVNRADGYALFAHIHLVDGLDLPPEQGLGVYCHGLQFKYVCPSSLRGSYNYTRAFIVYTWSDKEHFRWTPLSELPLSCGCISQVPVP
ncbi:hypothetical protein FVE85_1911 [Porphyridium purpureum]|uniref:Uncharacterized protein n=1 Tax=Porphyridium purpureum TaxID=35688 RepID=A0A5J4YWN3_PORPP|nr:hypothetical protein FVE85_1911 [Porphyridium purpureum]|eukprot:POR8134..scf209_3